MGKSTINKTKQRAYKSAYACNQRKAKDQRPAEAIKKFASDENQKSSDQVVRL